MTGKTISESFRRKDNSRAFSFLYYRTHSCRMKGEAYGRKSEPYKKAIKECIEKGIFADYLRRKGGEVINMLLDEYDYETDIEVQREEAYQIGEQAGLNKGREEGTLQDHLRFQKWSFLFEVFSE